MSVIDLNARRAPVTYTITVTHHWDGSLELFVEGIAESGRSNRTVADALLAAAAMAERNGESP